MSTTAKPPRNRKRQEASAASLEARRIAITSRLTLAPIQGYEGLYSAATDGHVYSHRNWRLLAGRFDTSGYLNVSLCDQDGNKKQVGVHRLVAKAFHGMPLEGKEQVNHINGSKTDNRPVNLEWVSRSENQRHAADLAMKPTGEASHLAKLTAAQVSEIRGMLGTMSQKAIGQKFSVSQTCIQKIASGKKWRND